MASANSPDVHDAEKKAIQAEIQMLDYGSARRNYMTTATDQRAREANVQKLYAERDFTKAGTVEARQAAANQQSLKLWNNPEAFGGGHDSELPEIGVGQSHRESLIATIGRKSSPNGDRDLMQQRAVSPTRGRRGSIGQSRGRSLARGGTVGRPAIPHGPSEPAFSNRDRPLDPAVDPDRQYRYKTGPQYGPQTAAQPGRGSVIQERAVTPKQQLGSRFPRRRSSTSQPTSATLKGNVREGRLTPPTHNSRTGSSDQLSQNQRPGGSGPRKHEYSGVLATADDFWEWNKNRIESLSGTSISKKPAVGTGTNIKDSAKDNKGKAQPSKNDVIPLPPRLEISKHVKKQSLEHIADALKDVSAEDFTDRHPSPDKVFEHELVPQSTNGDECISIEEPGSTSLLDQFTPVKGKAKAKLNVSIAVDRPLLSLLDHNDPETENVKTKTLFPEHRQQVRKIKSGIFEIDGQRYYAPQVLGVADPDASGKNESPELYGDPFTSTPQAISNQQKTEPEDTMNHLFSLKIDSPHLPQPAQSPISHWFDSHASVKPMPGLASTEKVDIKQEVSALSLTEKNLALHVSPHPQAAPSEAATSQKSTSQKSKGCLEQSSWAGRNPPGDVVRPAPAPKGLPLNYGSKGLPAWLGAELVSKGIPEPKPRSRPAAGNAGRQASAPAFDLTSQRNQGAILREMSRIKEPGAPKPSQDRRRVPSDTAKDTPAPTVRGAHRGNGNASSGLRFYMAGRKLAGNDSDNEL